MPQSFNPYQYAFNNPLLYTDPSGEFPHTIAFGLLGGLLGGISGSAFGYLTYDWALQGECGCEMQKMAQTMSKGQWTRQFAKNSALIGAVGAAIASIGPVGAIVVGSIGLTASAVDAIKISYIVFNETGLTWCTALRFSLDIIGLVSSASLIKKGASNWKATGDAWSWNPTGRGTASSNPRNWQDAERILGKDLGLEKNTTRYLSQEYGLAAKNYRQPDFVGRNFIADSKWYRKSSITNSSQLRDYVIIARTENKSLWLYVQKNTSISQTAINLLRSTGGGFVKYFP